MPKKRSAKWSEVKRKGVEGFPTEHQHIVWDIIKFCKSKGLFIVYKGELESWIDVGTRKKNLWIVLALERLALGECPVDLEICKR